MKKLVTILMLILFTSGAFAIETDKAAHFGLSYAMHTTTYGFARKAFRLEKKDALIFSLFSTVLLTTAAEYMGGPGSKVDGGDIKANVLGAGISAGTILMFDF